MLKDYDLDVNNNLVDLFPIVSDYIVKKKITLHWLNILI